MNLAHLIQIICGKSIFIPLILPVEFDSSLIIIYPWNFMIHFIPFYYSRQVNYV